jgi:hypothetical protein
MTGMRLLVSDCWLGEGKVVGSCMRETKGCKASAKIRPVRKPARVASLHSFDLRLANAIKKHNAGALCHCQCCLSAS